MKRSSDSKHLERAPGPAARELDEARQHQLALQRQAERICSLILGGDCPPVDIDIAIASLRDEAERLFPGCERLFAMIYESRFERLRRQFPRGIELP